MILIEALLLLHKEFKTDYNTTKIIMEKKKLTLSKSPTMIMIQEHRKTYIKTLEDYIEKFKDSDKEHVKENVIKARGRLKKQQVFIGKFEEILTVHMLFHGTVQQSVDRLKDAFIINEQGDVLVDSFLPSQVKVLEHVTKELTALATYYNKKAIKDDS